MIFQPVGYQQITTASAAVGLTVPGGASRALIQVDKQSGRWRDDGTDPSATVGMVIATSGLAGHLLDYRGDLSAWKFIETTAGCELNVTYFA